MGLNVDKKIPDAKQFIDYMNNMEVIQAENERLQNELKARDERDAEITRVMGLYEQYKDLLEDVPYAWYQVTLRNPEAIRQFFIKMRKAYGITTDDTENEAKNKKKGQSGRIDGVLNYIFDWVILNPARWSMMIKEYRGINKEI
jgi:hypothetical protein